MPHTASELGVAAPEAAAAVGEAVDPETGEPLGPHVRAQSVPAEIKRGLEGVTLGELPAVLREMSVQEYRRRLVALVRPAFQDWQDRVRAVLLDPAPGVFETAARELLDGAEDVLHDSINKIIIAPTKHADAYCALVRARFNGRLENIAEKRQDSELVAKAIQLIDDVTHRWKGVGESATKTALKGTIDALRALFSEKSQRMVGTVIEKGTEGEVRRILQLVRQSHSLTPTIVRATEASSSTASPSSSRRSSRRPRSRRKPTRSRSGSTRRRRASTAAAPSPLDRQRRARGGPPRDRPRARVRRHLGELRARRRARAPAHLAEPHRRHAHRARARDRRRPGDGRDRTRSASGRASSSRTRRTASRRRTRSSARGTPTRRTT